MKPQLFSQQLKENFTLGPVLACGIVFAEISEHVRAKENVMKINLLAKRVIGFVFALSLLLGIGLASSSVARAQWQDPYWRQREQQREQIRRQREWEREQRRRQRQSRDRRYDDRRYDDGYGNYGGSSQLRQTALNAGYNEGIKEGRKDRNNGERYEFRDEEDYRNANTDYSSRLGSRELYRQYFRQGFENGYADGYRGY
jgi:hypothetical protein